MTEWDASVVEARFQGQVSDEFRHRKPANLLRTEAQARFREFIRSYREGAVFVLRDQLQQRFRKREAYLEVDLRVLSAYDLALHDLVLKQPNEYLPAFEDAVKEVCIGLVGEGAAADVPDYQVVLKSSLDLTRIRDISAADVNHMLRVPGIVISAARAKPKATFISIRCKQCNTVKRLPCHSAFGSVTLPRTCDGQTGGNEGGGQALERCPIDPFVIVPDQCTYVDHQVLKLQEPPDMVPNGEMPRHVLLSVERSLVDTIAPGTRVSVLGIASIFTAAGKRSGGGGGGFGSSGGGASVRTPYLKVVGIQSEQAGAGRTTTQFTPEEEETFRALAREPDIYKRFCDSIAPSISGDYTNDIKKAIACLLMGGSRKVLPDGMKLRGDVNVLLLGDPSTAKSQFLKFVEKVAPVGVYTSGKGSSAAGLTATVLRDGKGEFYLEGGAMVLADGGVVCIDEFDKMREEDRVAIHEAMEQQTISIAKAGITTILNSRAAVLAAANPVFGRYDDMMSAAENIDFLPTILSRFDLIFIVRDFRNQIRDREIARHVISVHINAADTHADSDHADMDIQTMKRYIAYCRARCAPRLSESASRMLRDNYVKIRSEQRGRASADSVIPITVRQLEALVRLSEALAKITLSPIANEEHVAEAIRLFHVSTLNAASSGLGETAVGGELLKEVRRVEDTVKRRLPVGSVKDSRDIRNQALKLGFSSNAVTHALRVMAGRQEIQFLNEMRQIKRLK